MGLINNNVPFGGQSNNGGQMPSFGGNNNNGQGQQHSRPPAEYWLNVGVNMPGRGEKGEDVFLKLNTGIAIDDIKQTKVSGSEYWQQYTSAQNDLLAELMTIVQKLQPGEEQLVNLQVQVRRRKAEVGQVAQANNRFSFGPL